MMRRPKLTRPTVDLFERTGAVIDVNDLHRRHAFCARSGMWFPFRRLRTFPDRLEISWPDKTKPPVIILIEYTGLYLGGSRPWFVCHRCQHRVGKLYNINIDILCRKCYDLGYVSQRQTFKARLIVKAKRLRATLWTEGNKIIRPHYMHRRTFQKRLQIINRVERAIEHGLHVSSTRYQRWRQRDQYGRYYDEQADYEMI